MFAWLAIVAVVWIIAFVGLGLVAQEVQRRHGAALSIPPWWIGAIVATIVAGSIGMFGALVISALGEEDRRRRASEPRGPGA